MHLSHHRTYGSRIRGLVPTFAFIRVVSVSMYWIIWVCSSLADYYKVEEHFHKNKDFLIEQINIINPDIIILGLKNRGGITYLMFGNIDMERFWIQYISSKVE